LSCYKLTNTPAYAKIYSYMVDYEFTPEDDKLFDKLTETMNASEAREIILSKLGVHLGNKAITQAQSAPERPTAHRYSRRGGRSFPEPSDSELDPHWNVQDAPISEPANKAAQLALSELVEASRAASVRSYANRNAVSTTEAEARIQARSERKRRMA